MRVRIISVLILATAFAYFMPMVMKFGRALYVDNDFGFPRSTDFTFFGIAIILGFPAAAGLWLWDAKQRKLPLLILPACILASVVFGYANTALAFRTATERYDILTSDCFYTNALAVKGRNGIFVSSGGQTAYHPSSKVRSMVPVPGGA
jgi:hypothetical protein